MTFTIIDAAIIFIYLMGMLVLGFIMGKTNKTQEDYFVAKRSLPWLPIGLSIAATMISCNSFVGGPGWGYHSGLLPFMQNITVPLALFISTTIFVPMLYDLKLTSVYEYIELRLGPKTRMAAVLGFILKLPDSGQLHGVCPFPGPAAFYGCQHKHHNTGHCGDCGGLHNGRRNQGSYLDGCYPDIGNMGRPDRRNGFPVLKE